MNAISEKRVLCSASTGSGHTIPVLSLATKLQNAKNELSIVARSERVANLAANCGIKSIPLSINSQGPHGSLSEFHLLETHHPDITIVDYDPLMWITLRAWKPKCSVSILRSELLMHHQRRNIFLPDKFGFEDGSKTRQYNAMLKARGCEPVGDARELFAGDVVAIPSVPQIDPVSERTIEFYKNTVFVHTGPLFMSSHAPLSPSLLNWLAEKRQLGTPIALVTFGTAWGEALYGEFVNDLKDGELALVIIVPQDSVRAKLMRKSNKYLFVSEFIDVFALAKLVDVAIHHCGHATLQLVLLAGKPSITIPSGEYDREDNALRIEDLGCGRHLGHDFFRHGLRPASIIREANKLIHRPDVARRVTQMSISLSEYVEGRGFAEFEQALARRLATG